MATGDNWLGQLANMALGQNLNGFPASQSIFTQPATTTTIHVSDGGGGGGGVAWGSVPAQGPSFEEEAMWAYLRSMQNGEKPMDTKTKPKTKPKKALAEAVKPSAPLLPTAINEAALMEYAEVAEAIGLKSPEIAVERFKQYLRQAELPVYSLSEVVKFMDAKAAAENPTGWGWKWVPLRVKDNFAGAFGHPAGYAGSQTPASDFYSHGNVGVSSYDKRVPLHALKKVAKIEKEYSKNGEIAFFVADFQTEPSRKPDPFLLAVVKDGRGAEQFRFVLDWWLEPGFGLELQLKSDLKA